ncbi:MAG: ATP-binding cassette domain-containing protein [Phycisphaeraceae bacterium]|nr:ATP-binding cassette domain-containing protein [Phycisphaeraceae bacterium]
MFEIRDLDVATPADPATPLIRKLSLTVKAGEIVLLHGPSGCGKTTLLRILAGLIDPMDGQVRLDGEDGDSIGWPRFRRQVVLVQQRPVLLEGTVERNLAAPFAYKSADRPYSADAARSLLDRLGLPGGCHAQPARTLSEGEQQRVCLIRAILLQPRILLLDEPTSALDERIAGELDNLLSEWVATHPSAVLMVRHDVALARAVCTRAIDLTPHHVARQTVEAQR